MFNYFHVFCLEGSFSWWFEDVRGYWDEVMNDS